jgi:hypothetical protein
MDLILAIGKPSKFGHYAYPVKIYEGLMCEKIVLTTRTKSTEWILKDTPENLIEWGDELNAAQKIATRKNNYHPQNNNKTWEENFNILLQHFSSKN